MATANPSAKRAATQLRRWHFTLAEQHASAEQLKDLFKSTGRRYAFQLEVCPLCVRYVSAHHV